MWPIWSEIVDQSWRCLILGDSSIVHVSTFWENWHNWFGEVNDIWAIQNSKLLNPTFSTVEYPKQCQIPLERNLKWYYTLAVPTWHLHTCFNVTPRCLPKQHILSPFTTCSFNPLLICIGSLSFWANFVFKKLHELLESIKISPIDPQLSQTSYCVESNCTG